MRFEITLRHRGWRSRLFAPQPRLKRLVGRLCRHDLQRSQLRRARTSDRLLRQCRRRVFPTGIRAASESAPRAASSDCCRTCKASCSARLGDDLAASKPNGIAMMRLMPSRMSVVSIGSKFRHSASHAATSPSTSTASTNTKAMAPNAARRPWRAAILR